MDGFTIAAVAFCKGLVYLGLEKVLGRDPFPANPKGPLYKWFGKPKDSGRSEQP